MKNWLRIVVVVWILAAIVGGILDSRTSANKPTTPTQYVNEYAYVEGYKFYTNNHYCPSAASATRAFVAGCRVSARQH